MNNTFSLQQTSRTGNLDSDLISRQYKLNLMADFMRLKIENPQVKQSEMADQLSYSCGILQRYRNDIKMLRPYRIQPNITKKRSRKVSNTNRNNNSIHEHDIRRPQLTSNDLAKPNTNTKTIIKRTSNRRNKKIIKSGSVQENVESNDEYLDEFFIIRTLKWKYQCKLFLMIKL